MDGFRIPTLKPQTGLGADLALRHALEVDTYDMCCGHSCSFVSVEVQATATAFTRLFASPDLRRTLGDAGRQRAQRDYDWAAIILRSEALWAQQTELRLATRDQLKPLAHPWPRRMDPFHTFGAYPSGVLTPQPQLAPLDANHELAMDRVRQYQGLVMVNFAKQLLPSGAEVMAVLATAAHGPCEAGELVKGIAPARQAFVFRSLAWLAKLGVLEVIHSNMPNA